MLLSCVIISWNRRDVLLANLAALMRHLPPPKRQVEVIVVDNASTDGTSEAVAAAYPRVKLIRLDENLGMPARNAGIRASRGKYVMLLDDDSHPLGDAAARMIDYMQRTPACGALAASALLPDGRREASALPGVLIGCASLIRRSVLDQVGLFPEEFFRQAEEYDLSFRIRAGGWTVERFDDIEFRHNKAPGGRSSALTTRMDVRNNLILAHRYLPAHLAEIYSADWAARYLAIARTQDQLTTAEAAVHEAGEFIADPARLRRQVISAAVVESMLQFGQQASAVAAFSTTTNAQRVVIADYSKNLYATVQACRLAGLEVLAIADSRSAFAGLNYRGIDVVLLEEAIWRQPDAVVVSNVNPAQVDAAEALVKAQFAGPVLRLYHPRTFKLARAA